MFLFQGGEKRRETKQKLSPQSVPEGGYNDQEHLLFKHGHQRFCLREQSHFHVHNTTREPRESSFFLLLFFMYMVLLSPHRNWSDIIRQDELKGFKVVPLYLLHSFPFKSYPNFLHHFIFIPWIWFLILWLRFCAESPTKQRC